MNGDKVYCSHCANLFVLSGSVQPLCVATAGFIEGPLRKRIDVVGVIPAETRNCKNKCVHRASVSLHAWQVKRWLLWRMNDGSNSKIKTEGLKAYSVSTEADNKRLFEKEERHEERRKALKEIEIAKSKAKAEKARPKSKIIKAKHKTTVKKPTAKKRE